MVVLSTTMRQRIWRKFMAAGAVPPTVLKADARAAVDALDNWVDGNAAALNTALPQPFRGAATTEQKALLMAYVALERAGII